VRSPDLALTTVEQRASRIAEALSPYREVWGQRRTRVEVLAVVREQISLLSATTPEHFTREAIRKTRDDARDLLKTIKRLEHQIGRIRRSSPELRIRLGLSGAPPTTWCVDLAWMRAACEDAIRAASNEDRCKRRCVSTARFLIMVCSESEPTINFTNAIAGLLYAAVTGEKDQDFRWLCQQLLKQV
jgi:hypothetical protein